MLTKLLIAALTALVVMFIALVWLVCILAKVPLLLPALVTVFVVVAALTIELARRWRAARGARGLEAGMKEQAEQQQKQARPDLEPELRELQGTFDTALKALKNSPQGRNRGRDALYFLPWYAIIGPSGAGKTTLLRHSGLKFPSVQGGHDPKVRGLGGTRNCDWWLTNQAVLLDTAGRWSTQDEDRDEWLGFLGLLRKHRPRKPLNGVIAAISIDDLAKASEAEVDELARRMRERADEVIGQLHVSLPIYLLFTKCDLLEGFVEIFSGMSLAEREQVWGFTAPLSNDTHEVGAYFENQFGELTGRLEAISLARIGLERGVATRHLIYSFPQQVMALRHNLTRFVGAMFEGNVYHETPRLRGVYFTSGTQEGRPFSLLIDRLAEAAGVQDRMADEAPSIEQKSYFLRELFTSVIFEDQGIASASRSELRRQAVRRGVATAGLAAIALATGVIPTFAFARNRVQLTGTADLVDSWERPQARRTTEQEKLIGFRELAVQLTDYERNAPSFVITFGMYQGDRLRVPLRRYAAGLIRRELVQPLVARDVQQLTEFGFKYENEAAATPTAVEHAHLYDLLKLHLLLSSPRASDEPGLDRAYAAWVDDQLARRWSGLLRPKDEQQEAELRDLAHRYIGYAVEYAELAFARDQNVVRRSRAALNRVPLVRHALERLLVKTAQGDYDLSLPRLIGHVQGISATRTVRGAFTRRGWENVVREELNAGAVQHAGELWVLGLADRKDAQRQIEAQVEELSSLYFRAYADEWRGFLQSVRVTRPQNHTSALALVAELLHGQPTPLATLIQKVHHNAQLKPKQEEALTAVAETSLKERVGRLLGVGGDRPDAAVVDEVRDALEADASERFTAAHVVAGLSGFTSFGVAPDHGEDAPTGRLPLSLYEEQLRDVRAALQAHEDNPAQVEPLLVNLQAARQQVRSLIDGADPSWRAVLHALLEPPIESVAVSSNRAVADTLAQRWCREVVQPFDAKLRRYYPFERRAQDLALESFAEFYKPNTGTLWRFVREAMGNVVELDGDSYRFVKRYGHESASVYTASLLQFLARSRTISASFFPQGGDRPKLDFEVRIHPAPGVAMSAFSIGGQPVNYHNGPETWTALTWPGQDPDAGASLLARGANGMQERAIQQGAWGLFRLLEAGTITRPTSQMFAVAWELRTHDVTVKLDLRPARDDAPFFSRRAADGEGRLLQLLRDRTALVPRQIVRSGEACASESSH